MPSTGDIQIRISPAGRVYLDGLPEELLEIAAELCPDDTSIQRRLALLSQARQRAQQEAAKEQPHGNAASGQ